MLSTTGKGRLASDPEMKTFDNDKMVVSFDIASQRYDPKAENKKGTDFFTCKCWGKKGAAIAKYFSKGDEIVIYGNIIQEKWKNKEGENRSKPTINVQDFEFVGHSKEKKPVVKDDDPPF